MSAGCAHCYAERLAGRFSAPGLPFHGFAARRPPEGGPAHWTGRVELIPARLREALRRRSGGLVFVNSTSDLFHPNLPFAAVDQVWAVMALTPDVTYQVLTKRPERMRDYLVSHATGGHSVWAAAQDLHLPRGRVRPARSWPLANVWLGVSVENQAAADARLPLLLDTPGALHFASVEPLLGPVVFDLAARRLDWIIVGGESGPRARPCSVAWVADVVAQCRAAGVPVFVKQLGARASDPANRIAGAALEIPSGAEALVSVRLRDRAGADPREWPAFLRVREFPR